MKRLLISVMAIGIMGGTVYAQTVQQQSHSIGSLSCDATFTETYYAGNSGYKPTESFHGTDSLHWLFNVNNGTSYISVADPDNMLNMPSYNWISNGKPKDVNDVLVWSTNGSISVSSNVPSGYTPGTIISQLVFRLSRDSWQDGFVPWTINYEGNTENVLLADSANSADVDNECLNIYLEYCGDGVTQSGEGEECDDGNTNDNDGCKNNCTIPEGEDGLCGSVDNDDIYDFDNSGDALNQSSNNLCSAGTVINFSYNAGAHTWTWDCTGNNGGSTDSCQAEELRCGDGEDNGNEECDDGNNTNGDGCDNDCTYTPGTDGLCGSVDNDDIYDFDNSGDALNQSSNNLCSAGTVINFSYNAGTHTWTWDCTGNNGGSTDSCQAEELRCGDGEDNGNEECDDGNNTNGDGCETNCTNTYYCPSGSDNAGNVPETPGSSCDDGNSSTTNDTRDSTGCYCAGVPVTCPSGSDNAGNVPETPGSSCNDGDSSTINDVWDNTGCYCAGVPAPACGDGNIDAGEECGEPGLPVCEIWYECQACDCVYVPMCGNGMLDPGEECDDGNNTNGDGCDNDCTYTPNPACGDGNIDAGEECGEPGLPVCEIWYECQACDCVYVPMCGNGMLDPGEECDDANDVNGDGCDNDCTYTPNPACGDGNIDAGEECGEPGLPVCEIWYECQECDCVYVPMCGNGMLDPGEECDDANDVNGDGCDNDCTYTDGPECGDGNVDPGEECDDGNVNNNDDCKNNCTLPEEEDGSCEDLVISDNYGEIPFTSTFTCSGDGNDFEIILTDSDKIVIQTRHTSTASYTFTAVGEYHVQCLVDGESVAVCDHGSADGPLAEYPFQGGQLVTYEEYVQNSQTEDIIEETLESLDLTNVSPASSNQNTVELSPLYQSLTQTYHNVAAAVNSGCYDPCHGTVLAEEPNLTCDIDIYPSTTIYVNVSQKTVEVSCDIPGADEEDIYIDCDNGDSDYQGSVATCDYVRTGSSETFTPTCYTTDISCDASLTLRNTTGGDNYCGDGKYHPELGEECDDGANNGLTTSICSSNCERSRTGGGGGGGNRCGNGVVEGNEMCDDGAKNNGLTTSICSSHCDIIKGLDPAKCEFVDPPSIQLGEILPFWRGIESDEWIEDDVRCSTSRSIYNDFWPATQDIGKIDRDSMVCHFTITAPDGDTFDMERPCYTDEFTSENVEWYRDFLNDSNMKLENDRGTSYLDTSRLMSVNEVDDVYGEYTIELTRVDYDMCVGKGREIEEIDEEGNSIRYIDTQMNGMASFSYDGRICQYNFAVTSPYMVQKGISLSSNQDDINKLSRFMDIEGNSVLDGNELSPIDVLSTIDAKEDLEEEFITYSLRASEWVMDTNNDLSSLSTIMKKVPGEEIYYTNESVIIDSSDQNKPFNGGRPTTLLVDDGARVEVRGSLYGNLFILNPKGEIAFVNMDCDQQDTVQGMFLADIFTTSHSVYGNVYDTIANTDMKKPVRCDGGGLVVQGVLLGGSDASTLALRDSRRSTLTNWFDASTKRDIQIFEGAALRIQGSIGMWDDLPPITKSIVDILKISK